MNWQQDIPVPSGLQTVASFFPDGRPLRLLITNNTLAERAGSELYARDLARRWRSRGVSVMVYSNVPGEVAAEMREAGLAVTDTLENVEPPDLIHGQHHLETMTTLSRFPGVPAIYLCHGWRAWEEVAPSHPRIRRYAAVDALTRDHVREWTGREDVEMVGNPVDLDLYRPPAAPPPARPRRAAIFSNHAREENFVRPVRDACRAAGLEFEVWGRGVGRELREAEKVLPALDVVFSYGRCSLEALACGCAVVVCGIHGSGPMVQPDTLDELYADNIGNAAITGPVTAERIAAELSHYDAARRAETTRRFRQMAGWDPHLARLEKLYAEALAEARAVPPPDAAAETLALSRYLAFLSGRVKSLWGLERMRDTWQPRIDDLTRWCEDLQAHARRLEGEVERQAGSPAGRFVRAVSRWPLVGPLVRRLTGV